MALKAPSTIHTGTVTSAEVVNLPVTTGHLVARVTNTATTGAQLFATADGTDASSASTPISPGETVELRVTNPASIRPYVSLTATTSRPYRVELRNRFSTTVRQTRILSHPAGDWTAENPMLADGQVGYDETSLEFRVGDGVHRWANLMPIGGAPSGGLTAEQVQDIVGAMVEDGANTTVTYNDASGALTIAAPDVAPLDGSDHIARTYRPDLDRFNVMDYGAVGDGTTDDAAAIQNTITAAAAVGGAAFFPPKVFLSTVTLNVPSNVWLVGSGPGSVLLSTVAGTFAAVQSTGWSSSTAISNVRIQDLTFRRSVALAGTEGPYDAAVKLRTVTDLLIIGCRFEGAITGIQLERCTRFLISHCVGYRQGDATFRVNWSGSDGPGNPPVQSGAIVHCTSVDAGYQYGDGSALPNPLGPLGTAYVVTQSGVRISHCAGINSRHYAIETGDFPTGIAINDFDMVVDIDGRAAGMNLADLMHSEVVNCRAVIRAAGLAPINVNSTTTGTTDILVANCTGVSSDNVQRVGLSTAKTQGVVFRNCRYYGMTIDVGTSSTTDVLVDACVVRGTPTAGFQIASGSRIRVVDCVAQNCGASAAGDPKFLVGFVFDQLGADCVIDRNRSEDTRTGGSRTQRYGYYVVAGTNIAWGNNYALNNITAAGVADASPTYTTIPVTAGPT